jgi:hypothetical protein
MVVLRRSLLPNPQCKQSPDRGLENLSMLKITKNDQDEPMKTKAWLQLE